MCPRVFPVALALLAALTFLPPRSAAQIEEVPHPDKAPGQNQAPPRYDRDREAGESSSRDTQIDLSPPKDDAKDHPFSDASDSEQGDASAYSQELHPWDPHEAAKDVEVGDFYFKRKNYRAAIARYQDALLWKDNDADANFRLGQTYEKVDNSTQAAAHYQAYLKILPHGPYAAEAQKALEKLKQNDAANPTSAKEQSEHPDGKNSQR
jgi:tetratricopeptide (TPR) repeat protein